MKYANHRYKHRMYIYNVVNFKFFVIFLIKKFFLIKVIFISDNFCHLSFYKFFFSRNRIIPDYSIIVPTWLIFHIIFSYYLQINMKNLVSKATESIYIYNRKYEFPGKQVIHNYYGNYKIKYYRNMFNLLNSGIVI